MAAVSITRPSYGQTTGSQSGGLFTVRWSPPSGGDAGAFTRFRLICHACGLTLLTSSTNPSTFNIANLESQGHPGPFEIITDTNGSGEDVPVIVEAYAGSAGGGTAWPDTQTIWTSPNSTVSVAVHAVPEDGYRFLGWSRSRVDDGSYLSTSKSQSFNISAGPSGTSRTYFAHFARQLYSYTVTADYCVSPDSVTGRDRSRFRAATVSTTDRRRVRLYYYGVLYYRDGTKAYSGTNSFAYVNGLPYKYLPGERITVTLEIANQDLWDLLGLWVLGWRITAPYRDERGYAVSWVEPDVGGSVSFVTSSQLPEAGQYNVEIILASDDVHKLTFTCKPDDAADLYVYGRSYSAGNPTTRGVGTRTTYAAAGDLLNLEVMSILSPENGLVHGWSMDLLDSTAYIGSPVASKDLTMPNADTQVTVYLCNHMLLYGSSGSLLYGRQNSLLYNCSVPPGTTVYD